MQVNLIPCLDLIIVENEGGYSCNPKDPGGATNMGITIKTLSAWRHKDCTVDDVKNLRRSEAEAIMASEYARPVQFNVLPAGLDLCVLDCAINSGPARAVKILQGLLGVAQDGIIGSQTLSALKAKSATETEDLIGRYSDARLAFVKTLKTWDTFGNGWAARIDRVERRAMKLSSGTVPAAKPPIPVTAPGEVVPSTTGVAKATGDKKVLSTANGRRALLVLLSALITVGAAASQVVPLLTPYADVTWVRTLLTLLAVAVSVGTFAASCQKIVVGE